MFLLSEREGRTENIWLVVTTHGLRCVWSTRSDPTLPVNTHFIMGPPSFSFFLTSYIFFFLTSRGDIRWAVRLFPILLEPLSTFLIPRFFYALSELIRIRISKTHRCLLPVCKNTRVEDHQDVNQAYGY